LVRQQFDREVEVRSKLKSDEDQDDDHDDGDDGGEKVIEAERMKIERTRK
jgi:hypothetical protein